VAHVGVAEEHLDLYWVGSVAQHVGGAGAAQGVYGDGGLYGCVVSVLFEYVVYALACERAAYVVDP
jgi:hypothetical protein